MKERIIKRGLEDPFRSSLDGSNLEISFENDNEEDLEESQNSSISLQDQNSICIKISESEKSHQESFS